MSIIDRDRREAQELVDELVSTHLATVFEQINQRIMRGEASEGWVLAALRKWDDLDGAWLSWAANRK